MLVVYDRETGRIVGHCAQVFDNGKWRESSVEELYGHRDTAKLAGLYLPDNLRFLRYGPQHFRLTRDDNGVATGLVHNPHLALSCDAPDQDGDGVPELPADGVSSTRLTVTTGDKAAGVTVTFATSRGMLSQRTAVTDEDGRAGVELRGVTETVPVSVSVSAPDYRPAQLGLLLVPPPGDR